MSGIGSESIAQAGPVLRPPSRLFRSQAALHTMIAAIVAAVVGSVLAVGFVLFWGSPSAALAFLRGESVHVSQVVAPQPDPSSTSRELHFQVNNLTLSPITVFGAQASCSCVKIEGFPLTVPPCSARTLAARVPRHRGNDVNRDAYVVTLFTNPRFEEASFSLVAQ